MNKIAKFTRRGSLLFAVIAALVLATVLTGTPPQIAKAASGATVPYVEMEAEDQQTNGAVPANNWGRANYTLTGEASGRKAVTLSNQGQYVQFTLPRNANSIVVRYSIPDANNGQGATGQLGFYINGQAQTPLTLTSHWAWRYGGYQFTNNPGDGHPFQMYDEVHRMTGEMSAGTTVKLQVDSGDNVGPYTIDFADFEEVAAPIGQPAGSLSVTSYGADPSGAADSTSAIRNAISDGKTQGKVVYIPQGTYTLTGQLQRINNVTIQGAGMWYSTLHFTAVTGSNTVGVYGNYMPSGVTGAQDSSASQNVTLSDFAIFGEDNQRVDGDQDNGIGGAFSNSTIQNIWIEHTKCGLWLDGPMDKLTIKGMRIRDTEADGVNFHTGVTNSTVTNSDLRNTGDDGLAMWSEAVADANSSFTFDTVRLTPFANEIAIYGGSNDSMTDNYIADGPDIQGGGYHLGQRFNSTPMTGTFNISRNVAYRSGALDPNWNFGVGTIWIDARDAAINATINVDSNTLIDNSYEAFMFIDSNIQTVNVTNNVVDGTGTFAIQTHTQATTSWTNNTATHIGSEVSVNSAIYNCSGTGFVMNIGAGNGSWINDKPYCGPWPAPVYQQLATATPTATNTPCPPQGCPTNTPTLTPSLTFTPSQTFTSTPTPTPVQGTVVKAIDAGGGAINNWIADAYFDSGNQFSDTSTNIDTSGYLDTNPAPQAVYQTVRWNANFTYTIPGLNAGANYVVLLHWAELSFQAAGSRKFNVAINGTSVLSAFDVFAAAGFKHAIAKAFNATANGSGQIVIAFTNGGADNPFINGIEIISQTGGPTSTNTATFVPNTATVTVTSTPVTPVGGDGNPFNGTPYAIPGKVEAENYNTGGEGVAYHDTDPTNNGGQYRTADGVDIENTSDTGGGFDIGWTNAGEWMKYTVNVASTGKYNFDFRVASNVTGGQFHMEVDNVNVTGTIAGPNTGGWQTWTDVFANNINLTAGQHVLKLFTDAGGENYNWFNVTAAVSPTATGSLPPNTNTPVPTATTGGTDGTPYNGTPAAIPGTVQAENFNLGGEGVAYHDADTANQGGQYRTTEGVDIETTSDTGGGFNVGWTATGEWMKYTVNVASSGSYTVGFRVASPNTGSALHLEVDGNNVTGTVTVPNTGGWQTWTTTNATVSLTAGTHVLRLVTDAGGMNYNWFSFSTGSATATPTPAQGLVVAIDAGGAANGSYIADADFDSGNQFSDTSTAISTSAGLDSNPAPQGVYQTVRWNATFNYTIPNLTAGATYTVRLHWAELTFQSAGSRKFNVAINGTNVLTAFDVTAAAGFKQAISKSFTTTANASGQIVIAFTQGGADNPFINGIEILH